MMQKENCEKRKNIQKEHRGLCSEYNTISFLNFYPCMIWLPPMRETSSVIRDFKNPS